MSGMPAGLLNIHAEGELTLWVAISPMRQPIFSGTAEDVNRGLIRMDLLFQRKGRIDKSRVGFAPSRDPMTRRFDLGLPPLGPPTIIRIPIEVFEDTPLTVWTLILALDPKRDDAMVHFDKSSMTIGKNSNPGAFHASEPAL